MTFQSFIFLALLLSNYVAASSIRLPSRHNHFNKRSTLQNNGSGPCLTVSSNSNGAPVVVGSCSSTQWTFPSSGSGMIHVFGNKCLDVTNGNNANGNKLQIWTCNNGPNQKFALSNGQIQWKGTNKCIDLTNGNKANGTPAQLWQCTNGNTNQKWSYPSSSSSGGGGGSNAPSGSPFGKSKILLAYPDGDLSELNNLGPSNVFYNWSPEVGSLGSALGQGKVFLPQLWGWKQQGQFDQVAANSDAPIFLGPNEPNEAGQSNMDPGSGAALWQQSMEPLRKKGKKTCSPATSGNPNGLVWMRNFISECNGNCNFDYLCVHWYDTTFAKFQSWLEEWHSEYPNVPIIVTEFAPQNFNSGPQPNTGQVWEFYQQAIPWALSQPWIAAVAPYGFMQDLNINSNAQLMDGSSPNSLGKWILGQG